MNHSINSPPLTLHYKVALPRPKFHRSDARLPKVDEQNLCISGHGPSRRSFKLPRRNKSDYNPSRSIRLEKPKRSNSSVPAIFTSNLCNINFDQCKVNNKTDKNGFSGSLTRKVQLGPCTLKSTTSSNFDESEHTDATEDLTSSSAHWTNSEVFLQEIKPHSPKRAPSFNSTMESVKQNHIKKLQVIESMRAMEGRLASMLEKYKSAKQSLSTMARGLDKLSEELDDISSDEFSIDFSEDSSIYKIRESDEEMVSSDDESDTPDFAED